MNKSITHSVSRFAAFSQHWSRAVKCGCITSAILLIPASYVASQTPVGGGKKQLKTESGQVRGTVVYKGTVVDESDAPLVGVSVSLKGEKKLLAVTGTDGSFEVALPQGKHVLVFTYIGMKPQEVRIADGRTLKVRLESDTQMIGETVITGIYTRNIESFTGSVATFKGDDLKLVGAQNILRSLSALDPSIIITDNNLQGSNPNAMMDISINGKMNITQLEQMYDTDPNQPLFILDGFETTLQTVSDLNMDRVESISILKDAASTAIYGSKAANGVIVIETKKPQAGRLRFSYDGSLTVGWADLTDYNLMNAAEKLQYEKLAGVYRSTGSSQGFDENGEILEELYRELYYERLKMVKEGVDTYWMNEPLRTAYTQAHNVFVDGGDAAFRYGIGLSYNNTMGVMKESNRDVVNGNITLTYRVDNLSFTNQATVSSATSENPTVPFSRFSQMNPFYKKRTEDGEVPKYVFKEGKNSYVWNPLWDFRQKSFNEGENLSFTNNFQLEWKVIEALRLRANLQYSLSKNESEAFTSPNETAEMSKDKLKRGRYNRSNASDHSYSGRVNLTYGNTFANVHTLNAVAGIQFSEANRRSDTYSAQGYTTDKFSNPNFSNGYPEGSRPSSVESKTRSVSYYGNVNYSYDMRYLADFNLTSNGASQFGINDPFTTTWSFGLGWNLHREKFFKPNKFINYLKIRYSLGNPGNQNFEAKLASSVYNYVTSYNNPFGLAALISQWGNKNLKWQKTRTQTIGIDVQLFNSRLNFNVDYQVRKNDPMLMNIDLPGSVGASSAPMNIGATENKSITANITYYILKQKDLNWYINANMNHYTTKYYNIGDLLEKFNEEGRASRSLLRCYDGASTSALWVVRSAGIDPATGNEIFIRKDGTYTYEWNVDDEVPYGDSTPNLQGSVNTSFTYKDFSFGASFAYRLGGDTQLTTLLNKVENIGADELKYNQDKRALYDRWQKPGDHAKFKRIDDTSATPMSSRFIAEENTLECTSINVGYRTTTAPWLKYIGASSVSFNAYMNDIFRLSTVEEERGLEYPFERSVTFSVGISF